MIEQHLAYKVDLDKPIPKTFMNTLFATNNAQAHRIDIQLFRGNTPLTLPAGTTVNGKMLRRADPEKRTVSISGSASGNVASITLSRTAYAMSGAFSLNIDVAIGDAIGTVFHGEGSMLTGSTDVVEDDEKIIYNISDLLARIDAMQTATAAANAAAGNAQSVAATVQQKLDSGEFVGPQGPQGPQGEAPTEGPLDPNAKTGNPVALQDQWQGYPFGVKVNVEPVQSGSGDPSPSNVRPIVVPNPVTVERRTGENPYQGDTYSVNLPADFGGGTVDITGGTTGKRKRKLVLKGDTQGIDSAGPCVVIGSTIRCPVYIGSGKDCATQTPGNAICSHLKEVFSYEADEQSFFVAYDALYLKFPVGLFGSNDSTGFRAYLDAQYNAGTPVVVNYDLATPEGIEIPAVHIPALSGTNVLTTNGTSLEVSQRQGQPDMNAMLLRRIAALEAAATGI